MNALRKLAAMAAVLASVQSAQAMTYQYSVDKGRLVIQAMDTIEYGESRRFLKFIEDLPPQAFALFEGKAAIMFDSPGGNLPSALVLANILARYQLTTGVPSGALCASACVVAWAAGVHKTVGPDAGIGVHSASATTLDGMAIGGRANRAFERRYTGIMAEWLRRNGAPDNVVARALDTPSDSMYWLTADDLKAWKVTVTP